mgnify:CR=1 FL=1
MTSAKSMSSFEKQLLMEKKKRITSARCRICLEPIGEKPYHTFEDRYFHSNCLKLKSLCNDNEKIIN